jgi:MFS family permease
VFLVPRSVPRVARYTLLRQWRAELFAGVVEGTLGLASFVAMRSLGADRWIAALFVTFGQLFWLAAPAWEAAFARFHSRQAFLWMGMAANAPLIAIALVDPAEGRAAWHLPLFTAVIILAAAVDAAYVPHRGALLRANVPEAVRGRLYSLLSTVSKLSSIAAAKAGGWLLDRDPGWMRVIFPIAGACGLAEHWILSRIHWHREGRPAVRRWGGPRSALAAAADAWRETARILREDRAFFVFESGFMLYGLGFLMSTPVIVVYAERDMNLRYGQWASAQGLALPVAQILTTLACGRLVNRLGVVRISAIAFALLAVFFAAMPFVAGANHLIALYLLFGAAMALVNLGWALGPLSFAPPGRARSYITVHVLFVGVRSAIAPFFGLWLAEKVSRQAVFALSAALVAAGCATLVALARRAGRGTTGGPLAP